MKIDKTKALIVGLALFMIISITIGLGYCVGYVKGVLDTQDKMIDDVIKLIKNSQIELNIDLNESELVREIMDIYGPSSEVQMEGSPSERS